MLSGSATLARGFKRPSEGRHIRPTDDHWSPQTVQLLYYGSFSKHSYVLFDAIKKLQNTP